MKKIILFGICSLLFGAPKSWAVLSQNQTMEDFNTEECSTAKSQAACPAGCHWTEGRCQACPENSYCPKDGQPIGCGGGRTSPLGSKSETDCTCPDREIDNGTIPGQYNTTSRTCEYTQWNASCNNSEQCDGYHAIEENNKYKCVENKHDGCSESTRPEHYKNGFEVWDATHNEWRCLVTECEDGYITNNATYNHINDTTQVPITSWCQTGGSTGCIRPPTCSRNTLNGCKGTVDGTYKYTWQKSNDYKEASPDYSTCTCKEERNLATGTYIYECRYDNNKKAWKTDDACTFSSVESCKAGYCIRNNNTQCEAAPADFYSPTNSKECIACPFGTGTNTTRNTSVKYCKSQNGPNHAKLKFIEDDGNTQNEITLPELPFYINSFDEKALTTK